MVGMARKLAVTFRAAVTLLRVQLRLVPAQWPPQLTNP